MQMNLLACQTVPLQKREQNKGSYCLGQNNPVHLHYGHITLCRLYQYFRERKKTKEVI